MVKKNKAVFLDRDGVLVKSFVKNKKAYAPTKLKDFKIFKYSSSCIKKLNSHGFKTIVVTNQPDIDSKKLSKKTLNKMHYKLKKETNVKSIYSCHHSSQKNCKCRKPRTGMLIKAAKVNKIDFNKSYMVGDRYSDIVCGNSIGCKTIFIDRNYGEKKPKTQITSVKNLNEATKYILKNETR